jgi:hypothetical protein
MIGEEDCEHGEAECDTDVHICGLISIEKNTLTGKKICRHYSMPLYVGYYCNLEICKRVIKGEVKAI